jgi:hypothetical protein
MREKFRTGSYPINNLFRQEIGFYGGNPVPGDTLYPIELLKQLEERLSGAFTEITRIYTRKNDFHNAIRGNLFSLSDKGGNRYIAAVTPR